MINRRRFIVGGLVVGLGLMVASWWLLPRFISILPGSVQGRLPETLFEVIMTPLPTALPTPVSAEVGKVSEILIPSRTTPVGDESINLVKTPTPLAATISKTRQSSRETPIESVTPTSIPIPSPIILPLATSITDLEIIPQKFNNCGPANLTMALRFYGVNVDQLEIGEHVKPNYDDRNVSPDELVLYVNKETDLRARTVSGGDLTLLKRLIAAGYPVIVEKGLLLREHQGWMGHYLTLIGYDDNSQTFDSLDTFLGPFDAPSRSISFDELDEYWTHFNRIILLIYPTNEEERLVTLLGDRFQEEIVMWQSVVEDLQLSLENKAENAFLWFNLGTALTELGEVTGESIYFDNAALAYDRAFQIGLPWRMLWYQFKPYTAYLATGRFEDVLQLSGALLTSGGGQNVEETYLYRGHALLATGDLERAKQAYDRALNLNPNLIDAQKALADLEEITGERR